LNDAAEAKTVKAGELAAEAERQDGPGRRELAQA